MRRIILPSVACLAVPYFSTLSHKRRDFRITFTEHKMCVLIFCTTLSETFPILRRIQRDIIIHVHISSGKAPVTFVRFERNLEVLNRFSENTQMSNFMKIRPVGAELFFGPGGGTDRPTDIMKLIVAFRNLRTRLKAGHKYERLVPSGEGSQDRPVRSLVTIPTELPRLRICVHLIANKSR
jgi:hypothetical protein